MPDEQEDMLRLAELLRPLVRAWAEAPVPAEAPAPAIDGHDPHCPAVQAWDIPGACNCGRTTDD